MTSNAGDIQVRPLSPAGGVEVLGVDAYVHGQVETTHGSQKVVVRTDGRRPPHVGDTIHVNIGTDHIHVFDGGTEQRLGN